MPKSRFFMNIALEQVHEIIYKDVAHIYGSPGRRKCLSIRNKVLLYPKCVNITVFPESTTFFAYQFLRYGNAVRCSRVRDAQKKSVVLL